MYDNLTKKVLEKFRERLVMRKSEILNFMKNIKNPGDSSNAIDAVLRKLLDSKLIVPVYASESTFAITKKGMRELR